MVKEQDQGQDFLAQMYNLQQQYLNNLQQAFQPKPPASPMEQMWQTWNGQQPPNPFMQAPLGAWAQPGQDSLNAFYQQMNSQFGSLLQNSLGSGMGMGNWQGMQMPFTWPSLPGLENPAADLLKQLFSDEERAKAESLMQSLQQYQRVNLQIQQLMSQLAMESLEKLQAKAAEHGSDDLSQAPQWWGEISQQVFSEAQDSTIYKDLQQEIDKVRQQLLEDRDQYREALAKSLGLVTVQSFQAMRQQLDAMQQQIESLQKQAASVGADQSAADDFTVLKGVGEKLNERLHEHGVNTLNQLASMSDDMLKNLDSDLQAKGKVFQDQWREQAEQFLDVMSGKSTKE
jgi:predicted flap endonuclease-1-like 5' DNA nuclease